MIGIVLVSHSTLAEGLKNAAEMIVGPQERLVAIGMEMGMDLNQLRAQVAQAITEVSKGDKTLLLIDILGGNPANICSQLTNEDVYIVCGANLPMLLELLTQREHTIIHDSAEFAAQAAREGIIALK